MIRTLDAAFVNALANHPAVRPFIGDPARGALDFTAAVNDPKNVALTWAHGAFLFIHDEPGRYELHTMVLPEGRGSGVLPAFAEAVRHLFVRTDAVEIVTKTAQTNPAAALMARRAGFRATFRREAAWHDGSDLTFYALTFDEWRARDAAILAEGQAFHEAVERAKHLAGATLPAHPDDEPHDRAAGAACLMAKAGNPRKAVWLYNRWARLAGYRQIALVTETPALFDIGDAVITFSPDLEVLTCRPQQ